MLVEIGHDGTGQGPAVTYAHIPDEAYPLATEAIQAAGDIALHLARNPQVTHLPGLEPFLAISHSQGVIAAHGITEPRWVRSSSPELAALLAEFHGVPAEAPADLEDTHWTQHGSTSYPPGAIPDPAAEVTALLTNAGRDTWAANLWSSLGTATVVGQVGTATATTATSLTGGTESPGGSHAANDAAGQILVALATGSYGIVVSNTSGTAPVYTIDQWYKPGTPGGTAAATPGSASGYALLPGGPPAIFMGITNNSTAPAMTDVVLASEITVGTGDTGLIRKVGVTAHTAGASTSTLTAVFTASGVGSGLPVTVNKIAVGASIVATYKNTLQTPITAATLNVAGDQLTITDTITGS
jgi:hypothetical protein